MSRSEAPSPALLTDLYELTMMQAYVAEGMEDVAVFDLFVRALPAERNYLLACGLDDVLGFLETLAFDDAAIDYLKSLGRFSAPFLDYLARLRFSGDVYALPEGTPVFPFEPLLEIVAPLPQAQLVETIIMNQIGVQTVLASKAARLVAAAAGRPVFDFGFRRSQGIDGGLKGARAFHVAGVAGTSNVAAGQLYGVPVSGTMAHSYVQAHDDEFEAFRRFAACYPDTTLLVDTYDSMGGVDLVVKLARELGGAFRVSAVRLDSGDLAALARETRRRLDEAGLTGVRIFASGELNEHAIAALLAAGAPIDAFGVGTDLAVSRDAPSLDIVYKLVSYAGVDRLKLSPGKRVLPGRKQVLRQEEDGVAARDVIAGLDEEVEGRPLLVPVMKAGQRLRAGQDTLAVIRGRAEAELAKLPLRLRALTPTTPPYRTDVTQGLQQHYEELASTHRLHADQRTESRSPEGISGADTRHDRTAEPAASVALLIVDVQTDFCPGGALAVPDGVVVIDPLNRVARRFASNGQAVYASRDWHPLDSKHFKPQGGPWPVHCVAGSPGAELHPRLELPPGAVVISKGQGRDEHGYSAFDGTTPAGLPLAEDLRRRGVAHLHVGGLATDYCVRASVLDARRLGFDVTVLTDAIAGIDAASTRSALAEMQGAGAQLLTSHALEARSETDR